MCSTEGVASHQPSGKLAEDIASTFGSFDEFKREFNTAGSQLFGSGYVWLVENEHGVLSITTTQNQVMQQHLTIMSGGVILMYSLTRSGLSTFQ